MARLFTFLTLAVFTIGALFIPRLRDAQAAGSGANIGPGIEGIGPVPLGASTTGLRNNNPFNLEFRTSVQWRGQLGTDGRFVVFDTALNGLRAGMINIHTKMVRDGLSSVRRIISVLSPSSENPTEAFIVFVSQRMGVSPDQPLVFTQHIIPMSKAIVQFENGQNPFPDSLYRQALMATGRG